jgi:hypothetical protein
VHQTEKTWRTLVRATRHDNAYIYAVLPGFDTHQEVAIPKDMIPQYALENIEAAIDEEGVYRFHVHCNIGAEDPNNLQFVAPWEVE